MNLLHVSGRDWPNADWTLSGRAEGGALPPTEAS